MIRKIIAPELVEKVKKLIDSTHSFSIVAHVSPDGDACGSALSMWHYLRGLKKDACVVLHDQVGANLRWMPGLDQVVFFDQEPEKAIRTIQASEAIICVDFNAASRMGKLKETVLDSAAPKVMVDHHLYPEDFCDITISHPQISSASELMYRLFWQMDVHKKLSEDAATVIYTGMMTDTGAFTYNSNMYETYYVIADLIKLGIDKDQIYDRVFNACSENRERLKGYVLSQKMRLYRDYGASLFTLEQDELQAHHYQKGDSEGFVNMPLSIEGIYFSVFLREDKEYIKVSLRSKGDFPCNLFAETYFNGGGHKNASGGEFWGTMAEAIALFESALPVFYDTLKK